MHKNIQLFTLSISLLVAGIVENTYAAEMMVYPLKEISNLECRFQDFDTLSGDCKQDLPVLKTKDYKKYSTKDDGYNDFTRLYTVLWGASYEYGWDIGHGGHQGIDIATAKGTPVYSIADGIVIVAKKDIAWGNVISIEHVIDGQKVVSDYAHLSKIDIEEGDKVNVGDKIGEVGSTGNSTGNHLHFQIDIAGADFYPYYYSYSECPHSYYEITENGICFDILEENTLDPLAFLETSGAALSDKKTTTQKNKIKKDVSGDSQTQDTSAKNYTSIFDTYVYLDTGTQADIKQVQQIYTDLGYYTGNISGNYADVLDSILNYQLKTGIISDKSADGAGYFGPKTRAQTQKDYITYIVAGGVDNTLAISKETTKDISQQYVQEKKEILSGETISKQSLMTRDEIEKKERNDFLKMYGFDIFNSRELDIIPINGSIGFSLTLRNKKGSGYEGSTPGNISFKYESDLIDIFPKEFFYFKDGEREIQITGLKTGTTKLDILFGDEIVKTFRVTVGEATQNTGVTTGKIYMAGESVMGEAKTGLAVFKNSLGDIMIGKNYGGTFKLESDGNILYCIKKGKIKDVQRIFKKKCADTEYSSTLEYNYDDTVAGLLIFDYKSMSENQGISLGDVTQDKIFATQSIVAGAPVGLEQNYAYYSEILDTLKNGITTTGISKGYFLEERELTQSEAYIWVENTLSHMYVRAENESEKAKLFEKLTHIGENRKDTLKTLTRKEFLELASSYIQVTGLGGSLKDYLDLDETEDQTVAAFFDTENTWKDAFGQDYFRPNQRITRGEGAYFVALALKRSSEVLLTRK